MHSDMNDTNILFKTIDLPSASTVTTAEGILHSTLKSEEKYEVGAVLDWGDAGYDYILFDVGVCAGYACMHQDKKEVTETIADVIRGYFRETMGTDIFEACAQLYVNKNLSIFNSTSAATTTTSNHNVQTILNLLIQIVAASRLIYVTALGRQLQSFAFGREQMSMRPDDEYIAHTVQPIWDAAKGHLKFAGTDEAMDSLLGHLFNGGAE